MSALCIVRLLPLANGQMHLPPWGVTRWWRGLLPNFFGHLFIFVPVLSTLLQLFVVFWCLVCCCVADIMNRKPREAWELYLKMETSSESFSLLQVIANDCYKVCSAWVLNQYCLLTLLLLLLTYYWHNYCDFYSLLILIMLKTLILVCVF